MSENWREEYQRVHLDCIARDVRWLSDKARSVAGYARQLSSPPIIKDAKEELATAELALTDALVSVRQSRRDLANHIKPTLQAAE